MISESFYDKRERGYFSSSRPGGKAMDDVYFFRVPPLEIAVRGVVRDTTNPHSEYRVKGAKIQLMTEAGLVSAFETSEDGTYFFKTWKKMWIISLKLHSEEISSQIHTPSQHVEFMWILQLSLM